MRGDLSWPHVCTTRLPGDCPLRDPRTALEGPARLCPHPALTPRPGVGGHNHFLRFIKPKWEKS